MHDENLNQIQQIALQRSIPFCYACNEQAPSGRCQSCGSDDLARLLLGIGCDFGLEWIINFILGSELQPVDLEEQFEESVRQCYPETTQVGWMDLNTVGLMKEHDPVSWRCALSDCESQEKSEGNIISFDSRATFFLMEDGQEFISVS